MARKTISVPDDIEEQIKKAPEVNWSQVATDAFRIKLGEFAQSKKEKEMTDVIARLRGSKTKTDDDNYKSGFQLGQEWAKDTAEYSQLRNLAECRSHHNSNHPYDWDWYLNQEDIRGELAAKIISVPEGEEFHWRDEIQEFWETALSEDQTFRHQPGVLKGFCDGALDVYDQVVDKL